MGRPKKPTVALSVVAPVPAPALVPTPTLTPGSEFVTKIKALVLKTLDVQNSRVAYDRAMTQFFTWFAALPDDRRVMNWATVMEYRSELMESSLSKSSINLRITVVRKIAEVAWFNQLLPQETAMAIKSIRGLKNTDKRLGNWLTLEQAETLINCTGKTLKGVRDRAILAVLVGCGLRRAELVSLTHGHLQQRQGRWVITDLEGKGSKIRSIPMAEWVKEAIDAWVARVPEELKGTGKRLFLSVRRMPSYRTTPRLTAFGRAMTPQAIYNLVDAYTTACGLSGAVQVSPHDLRRTFSRLAVEARKDGVREIQQSLGHASVTTTEIYLGSQQNIKDAPSDWIKIRLTPSGEDTSTTQSTEPEPATTT